MDRQDDSSLHLFVAICLWGISLWVFFVVSTFADIFKDGLGPDAVRSHGLLALSRWWLGVCWPFCLIVVPVHALGWVVYWRDPKR
jgi:hypothetical protein